MDALEPTRRDPAVRAIGEDVAAELADYSDERGLSFPQEVHEVRVAAQAGARREATSPRRPLVA